MGWRRGTTLARLTAQHIHGEHRHLDAVFVSIESLQKPRVLLHHKLPAHTIRVRGWILLHYPLSASVPQHEHTCSHGCAQALENTLNCAGEGWSWMGGEGSTPHIFVCPKLVFPARMHLQHHTTYNNSSVPISLHAPPSSSQHHSAPLSTVHHHSIPLSTTLYHSTPLSTTQHHSKPTYT